MGVTVYCVGVEPVISSSYRFARTFFESVAEATHGQYVTLGSSTMLASVIIGGAAEELALERLMAAARKELEEGVRRGAIVLDDKEACSSYLCAEINSMGFRSKQLQRNGKELEEHSAEAKEWSTCATLSEVRAKTASMPMVRDCSSGGFSFGGSVAPVTGGPFGAAPAASGCGMLTFGAAATPAFGSAAASSSSGFSLGGSGAAPAASGCGMLTFGAAGTPAFGSAAASSSSGFSFGGSGAAPAASGCGALTFGAAAAPAFGATADSLYGAPAASEMFGAAPAATAATCFGFGSTRTGMFGEPAAKATFVEAMSVKELKAFLGERGVSLVGVTEKSELLALAQGQDAKSGIVRHGAPAAAEAFGSTGGPPRPMASESDSWTFVEAPVSSSQCKRLYSKILSSLDGI